MKKFYTAYTIDFHKAQSSPDFLENCYCDAYPKTCSETSKTREQFSCFLDFRTESYSLRKPLGHLIQ